MRVRGTGAVDGRGGRGTVAEGRDRQEWGRGSALATWILSCRATDPWTEPQDACPARSCGL